LNLEGGIVTRVEVGKKKKPGKPNAACKNARKGGKQSKIARTKKCAWMKKKGRGG